MEGMQEDEVVKLMQSSRSPEEWNRNCQTVKTACGGRYPAFWYSAILSSGVASATLAKFGESVDIRWEVW
jgi:hypothetical protein